MRNEPTCQIIQLVYRFPFDRLPFGNPLQGHNRVSQALVRTDKESFIWNIFADFLGLGDLQGRRLQNLSLDFDGASKGSAIIYDDLLIGAGSRGAKRNKE